MHGRALANTRVLLHVMLRATIVGSLGLALAGPAAHVALAQDAAPANSPRTMIVLDGSNSMWGEIGGRDKIEIARETLSTVLQSLPIDQELGLVAYGHRRRGDCSDIEELVPLNNAASSIGAIADSAGRVRPVGKTPLTDATRFAAERVRYTEERATVVVITDGIETCEADPCAAARELERDGIDFTAHVVGFGLSEAEGAQVACLAEETGGRYIQASDADALANALSTVVAQAPEPTIEEAAGEPRTVGIDLRDTRNGPLLTAREVSATLVPLASGPGDDLIEAEAAYEPTPDGAASLQASLAPGRYQLLVTRDYGWENPESYREVSYESEITVEGTENERLAVVLPGGILSVRGLVHAGEPLPDQDFPSTHLYSRANFAVHRTIDGVPEEAPWFDHTIDFPPTGLPAGEYLVRGTLGLATRDLPITIGDGERIDQTLDFEAARLRLALHYDDGRPMEAGMAYASVCPIWWSECGNWLSIGSAEEPVRIFVPAGETIRAYGHHYYSNGKGDKGSSAATAIIPPLEAGEERLVDLRAENNPPDYEAQAKAAIARGNPADAVGEDDGGAAVQGEDGNALVAIEAPNAETPGGDANEAATLELRNDEPATTAPDANGYPRLYRVLSDGLDYGTVSVQPGGPETFTPGEGFCRIAASCAEEIQLVEAVGAPDGTAEGTFTVSGELYRIILSEERQSVVLMVSDVAKLAERPPVSGTLEPVERSVTTTPTLDPAKTQTDALLGIWMFTTGETTDIDTCIADHLAVLPDGRFFRATMSDGTHRPHDMSVPCTQTGGEVVCRQSHGASLVGNALRDGERLEVCVEGECSLFRSCAATLRESDDPRAAALLELVRADGAPQQ